MKNDLNKKNYEKKNIYYTINNFKKIVMKKKSKKNPKKIIFNVVLSILFIFISYFNFIAIIHDI